MAIIAFPNIEDADENGLLAVGGDLEVSSLLLAYSEGIFPWPLSEDLPLAWFSPDPRGVMFFNDFHVPKSLIKSIKRKNYTFKFNTRFRDVIENCSHQTNRKDSQGTWITEEIKSAYYELHLNGFSYSVETYREDELVGGLYGVHFAGMVSGESMFYRETDASKAALYFLVSHLKNKGFKWLDTQMVTPVVENMGGRNIERKEFMKILKESLKKSHDKNLFDLGQIN